MTQRTRILIGTTQGPIQVLAIREEGGDPPSALFLNGTTTRLPVSRAYRDFVETPSGVVERIIGHRSFRTDVSGQIDAGNSWQLGILIAHILAKGASLAGRNTEYDELTWCSGEVHHIPGTDFAIEVRKIDFLEEKLTLSASYLQEAHAQGKTTRIVLPQSNVTPEIRALVENLCPSATIIGYDEIDLKAFAAGWRSPGSEPERTAIPPVPETAARPQVLAASIASLDEKDSRRSAAEPDYDVSRPDRTKRLGLAALALAAITGGAIYSYIAFSPFKDDVPTDIATPASGEVVSDVAPEPAPASEPTSPEPSQQTQPPPDNPPSAVVAADWTNDIALTVSASLVEGAGSCVDGGEISEIKRSVRLDSAQPIVISDRICGGRLKIENSSEHQMRILLTGSGAAAGRQILIHPAQSGYILLQRTDANSTLRIEPLDTSLSAMEFALFETVSAP